MRIDQMKMTRTEFEARLQVVHPLDKMLMENGAVLPRRVEMACMYAFASKMTGPKADFLRSAYIELLTGGELSFIFVPLGSAVPTFTLEWNS
jgi:hypothetical protein